MLKAKPWRHDGMRVNVSHSTAPLDVVDFADTPRGEDELNQVQLDPRVSQ